MKKPFYLKKKQKTKITRSPESQLIEDKLDAEDRFLEIMRQIEEKEKRKGRIVKMIKGDLNARNNQS